MPSSLRQFSLTVIALLLLSMSLYPLAAGEKDGKTYTITVPKPSLRAVYAKGLIVYPRLSTPAFVEPGSKLTILLARKLQVKEVILDDGFGHILRFKFNNTAANTVTVKVPPNTPKGLYDLIIVTSKAAYGEPKAVYIASRNDVGTIYIFHVTDRHFGVINGNGRAASNYDLAAVMIALGLPNNTIVIDTGDIADNAAASEYSESLAVDWLLNKPMITIPGNHDHVGGSKLYSVYRGMYNYTLSIYGLYRLVAIDSGSEGYIDDVEAAWASNVLSNAREPVTIVLFHHPHFTHLYSSKPIVFTVESAEKLYELLISKKPNSRYPYIYTSWLTNREALRRLVEAIYNCPSKLVLVLSGHIHMDSYAKVIRRDGSIIQYVVTTATGGSVRTYRHDYHGFRIIKVSTNASYEILGDGEPWNLHASFNLENTTVAIVSSDNAVSVQFKLGDPKVANYMVKTVLALPVPPSYYGKKVNVLLMGLDKIALRCTALGCIAYGVSNHPPKPGKLYLMALYTKPDREPPQIANVKIQPIKPTVGTPVTVEFTVSDDSWGVAQVYAKVSYNGRTTVYMPAHFGNKYRLVIPKINATKATVEIIAVDGSGKIARKSIVVEYYKRTQTTTTAQSKTATTTTAKTAEVTEKTVVETKMTTPAAQTTTPAAQSTSPPSITATTVTATITYGEEGTPLTAIAVAVLALAVGIVLTVYTLRRI